jgi:hypothetical protein
MTKLPDSDDVFATVPALYPFEEQLADNKAKLEAQQDENPLPEPFAAQVNGGVKAHKGSPQPTQTDEVSPGTTVHESFPDPQTTAQAKPQTKTQTSKG